MKKKIYILLRNLLLIVSIFVVIITFTNCKSVGPVVYSAGQNQDINGYKTFVTPDNEDIRYSFEYPGYYWINPQEGLPFGMEVATGKGITKEEGDQGKINIIYIRIPYAKGDNNADNGMKENISGVKWELLRNFRLTQKHRVIVNGYEGWETIMTFRQRKSLYHGAYATAVPPAFIIQRDIFLYHQGVTYQIQIYADEESYEQNKGDFEHILKTFKIIE